jgi:hypothetical protein
MAQILTQPLGADRPWFMTLRDEATGAVIVDYPATDPLECTIWSGQDQAPAASPAATWVDAAAGLVQVLVAASDTAGLRPGLYRMVAAVTHEGARLPFFDGSIELTPEPGAAPPPAVYCSYEDVLLYAPQIDRLQDADAGLAGFLGERARARAWVDEVCLDGYRPNHGRARRMVAADGAAPGPYLRWVAAGPGGAATPTVEDLRDAIAADGLVVTAQIREAVAHMAAAIVLLNQPGVNNPYHQNGAYHAARAEALLRAAVVEVDLDGDGVADVRVDQDVTWLA